MVQGIEHVGIASADPLKLAQWYVDHLGFTINFLPPGGKAAFVRAADGSMIEIIESDAAPAEYRMKEPGLRHLAIAVSDFEGVYRRLKSMEIEFITEPTTVGPNTFAFFKDVDGNILHLIHREKPLP